MKIVGKKDLLGRRRDLLKDLNEKIDQKMSEATPSGILQAVYAEKIKEAEEIVKEKTDSDADRHPFLFAEAKIRGIDIKTLAESVIEERKKWQSKMSELEVKRIRAKSIIMTTNIIAEMEKTVNEID